MSKQSNQRYKKERGLNHKERAKNNTSSNKSATNASREGYGDGNPYGFSKSKDKN